jgi:drug/metabolite transporter (DMT)-like permease
MSRTLANLTLLLATAIWGGAFIFQKVGLGDLGPFTFTGVRFLLGAVVIAPLALGEIRRVRLDRRDWQTMAVLGAVLFAGAVIQQIGIEHTTAANAGFLTTLYVVMVPLLELAVLRRRPHPVVWPAALGSLAGAWLLSGGAISFHSGDGLVIVSALFWTVQIMLISHAARRSGAPMVVALAQSVICGVLSTGWGLVAEPVTWPALASSWVALAYTGFVSAGIAFTLQVVGQRYTTGSDAAITLSAEAPFAALFGALILGERMDAPQAAGCALIMACILMVQLVPVWRASRASA